MILDRTAAPEATPISSPNFPAFKNQLINGIDITTFTSSDQPIIFLELVFNAGKAYETISEQSYFTSKLLTGGTGTKSAETISETLDFFGSHLEINSSFDYLNIKLYSLKKFFPQLLVLLQDLIHNSDFPAKELSIQKSIRKQQLRQQQSKNNIIASQLFRKNLFEKHTYGHIPHVDDADSISKEHLLQFHKDKLSETPKIYLTGDLNDQLIEDVIELFDENKQQSSSKQKITEPAVFDLYEEKEDAVQTSIRLGLRTINRSHKDYHYLKITNDLLGGYFGSRLMKNIREDKGLTYGISSSISHLADASYWIIGSDVLKEKRQLAMDEIEKEIVTLQKDLVDNMELNSLKNYLRGKFLSAFDSPFSSAQMIKTVVAWNLKPQVWEDYLSAIDTITPEDIVSIANQYFDLNQINKVMVG